MTLQYRIAPEGQVRDVDESKREVQVVFPWEVLDTYNTDFERACFDEFLTSQLPVMCWQHQRTEPIGRARSWQKTSDANEFVAGFSDFDAVPRSRQAFAQLRDKEITDFSFGFDEATAVPHPQTRGAVRFTRARMPEISPVTVGSIPGAVAVAIRAEAEVANIRGLVDAGAITEEEAVEMMRAAGVEPERERLSVGTMTVTVDTEGVREAIAQAVAEQLTAAGVDPVVPAESAFASCLERSAAAANDGDWQAAREQAEAAVVFAADLASPDDVGDGDRAAEDDTAPTQADAPGEPVAVPDPAADTTGGDRQGDELDLRAAEAETLALIDQRLAG